MKVAKADAVKVMVAIGFKAAEDYTDERLATKLNKFHTLLTDDNKPKDKATLTLAKAIAKATKGGDEIEIAAGKPAKGGKVTNVAPPAKGKKAPPPEDDDEDDGEDSELDEEEEDEEDTEEEADDEEEEEEGDEDGEGEDEDGGEDEEEDEDSESEDEEEADEDDEDSELEEELEDEEDDPEDDTEEEDEDSDDEESEEDSEDEDDTEDEEDDEEMEAPAKKPAKKTDNKKTAPSKNGKPAAKTGFPPKAGVIDAVVAILSAATAEKPVSMTKLIEKVNAKCGGDRAATIRQQVPRRLISEKGLNVVKVEGKGFYIAQGKAKGKPAAKKDGAKPAPAKKKTAKK